MLLTTQRKIKKWIVRLLWFMFCGFIIWANYNRFNHNNFANYEKAVDFGRVREVEDVVQPVIAAVFYRNDKAKHKSLTSYLSHWDRDRIQNPKMLAVPKQITPESKQVISKLYAEINKAGKYDQILLIYNGLFTEKEHLALLKHQFKTAAVTLFPVDKNEVELEKKAEKTLNTDKMLIVALLELNEDEQDKFLLDEMIYLAQKKSYKIRIFDEVDTQLAQAQEENYASWFETENGNKISELQRQKNNLVKYKEHYGADILNYFTHNLALSPETSIFWPDKTAQTYRLFDRGAVYIRFFGTNGKEIFSRAKIGKNKGIIVAVIELARKAVIKVKHRIASYKIYILTELEKIEKDINTPLINYLETDDGVYIQYRGHNALLAADERPQDERALMTALRIRAKVPDSAADSDIEYYKFKTVEIQNEN